jgi:hypothetical protein
MKSLHQVDLTEAAHAYAVANTPLYLTRKLREDRAAYEISRSLSGDEILTALDNALRVKPVDATGYVRPFVYLVALWFKPEDKYLKMSPRAPGASPRDWYNYVRGVLLETYSPTIDQSVRIPPSLRVSTPTIRTDAPSKLLRIDLRKGQ